MSFSTRSLPAGCLFNCRTPSTSSPTVPNARNHPRDTFVKSAVLLVSLHSYQDPETYPRPYSPVILSVIARQSTRWVTQAVKNLGRAMFVELVEVRSIIWKTASSCSRVEPKDLAGTLRRRSLVRLLLHPRSLCACSLARLADECWFCLSNPAIA